MALPGGLAIPLHRLHCILGHAPAIVVAVTQIGLRRGIVLFGGPAKPLYRLLLVLPHALAIGVAVAQIELRRGKILFGRLAIPLYRLAIILLHPPAVIVAKAQIELSLGVALLGFGFIFLEFGGNGDVCRRGVAGRKQAGDVLEDGASESFHQVETYAWALQNCKLNPAADRQFALANAGRDCHAVNPTAARLAQW